MDLEMPHLCGWIGREENASGEASVELVQRFSATFDRSEEVRPGAIAPLMLHWCMTQGVASTAVLGNDGHPARGGFLPPVPLPRRMWAGGTLEFHGDVRIGDTLTRRSRIAGVSVKQGRTGTLCFVSVDHAYDTGGKTVISERQDIVYRPAVTAPTAPAPAAQPAETGEFSREFTPSAVFLFRYSALTFNGHRIHYDLPYARDVEHYPDLVVHGQLLATLLANYATDLHGSRPRHFSFRSFSPLFVSSPFRLNASAEGAAIKLWTAQADGPVAMEARAEW